MTIKRRLLLTIVAGGLLFGPLVYAGEPEETVVITKKEIEKYSQVMEIQRQLIMKTQQSARKWNKEYINLKSCVEQSILKQFPVSICLGAEVM